MATLGNTHDDPNNEKRHPVDAGDLLALIRNQRFAKEAFVRQHLTECAHCQQRHASLAQTSKTLEVVGQVAMYQRYPELSSSLLLKNGRLGYAQRRFSGRRAARYAYNATRPRPSAIRLMVPVAMAILLTTITLVIVLAKFGLVVGPQHVPNGGLSPAQSIATTGIAQHRVTPTIVVTVTPLGGGVILPPGGTTKDMPSIVNCTTPRDAMFHILVICGSNFTPGDTVVLFMTYDGRSPMSSHPVQVNENGKFFYHLITFSCKDVPVSIYARDITSASPEVSSNKLVDLAVPGCL